MQDPPLYMKLVLKILGQCCNCQQNVKVDVANRLGSLHFSKEIEFYLERDEKI
jgi:hypothetical protein